MPCRLAQRRIQSLLVGLYCWKVVCPSAESLCVCLLHTCPLYLARCCTDTSVGISLVEWPKVSYFTSLGYEQASSLIEYALGAG
jgi:hypothetical protein